MVARPRRLDGRVQGQQVGLVGDAADGAGDFADRLRPALQLLNAGDRADLALGVALYGAHGGGDLDRAIGEHRLQRFRAAARGIGLGPRQRQRLDRGVHRAKLLVRAAGGLLCPGRDLLHRPAELLGGGGCLHQSRGHLLGGRGDPFGKLVFAGGAAAGDSGALGPGLREGRAGAGWSRSDIARFHQGHGYPATPALEPTRRSRRLLF